MLIDWVTARVPLDCLRTKDRLRLRDLGDRIQRFNPATGEVAWETSAWDSIRSDSHAISYRCGSDALWMQGSPARVMGDGDAVFGSGASAALDLPGCVERMRDYVFGILDVRRKPPSAEFFLVSRVDVTENLLVGSLADVRAGLAELRGCEGGRYRVSQQAGDTVYWSQRSRLRKGKAYAKGPHLRYQMRKLDYHGRRYSDEELMMADCLLRLEHTLGAQWWRERAGNPWYQVTAKDLKSEWHSYFDRMLGKAEVTEMNIEEKVQQVAKTEGQAKAAIGCWALIKAYGWEKARDMTSRTTWYRNLSILRAAGLSDADLSAGNVVAIRRPLIQCQTVESWQDLREKFALMRAA